MKTLNEIDHPLANRVYMWFCEKEKAILNEGFFIGSDDAEYKFAELVERIQELEQENIKLRLKESGHFIEKPKTRYDWSKAPRWAQWAATDLDGEVFWYENKPSSGAGYWRTVFGQDKHFEKISDYCKDGQDSLEQRPKEV